MLNTQALQISTEELSNYVQYADLMDRYKPMLNCVMKSTHSYRSYAQYLLIDKGVAAVTDGYAMLYSRITYGGKGCFDKNFKLVQGEKIPDFTSPINSANYHGSLDTGAIDEFLKLSYKSKTPELMLTFESGGVPAIMLRKKGYSIARINQFMKGLPKGSKLKEVRYSNDGILSLDFDRHSIFLLATDY